MHQVQIDCLGYAFPYDDVKPELNMESEISGTISFDNAKVIRLYVGGQDSGDDEQSDKQHAPDSASHVTSL